MDSNPSQPRGLFPWIRTLLVGPQTQRLTERLHSTHWLSYLLVITQSVAVVLVLGHSLLALMLAGDWFIRGVATAGLFVLVSSVYAADMALLATMKRVPALVRNRASWALYEAVMYVFFVLVIEASTFGIVAAILDTNPRALLAPAPIIPVHGLTFIVQIVARAVLLAWTILQLFIVAGTMPPQLSTLMATGKEVVGAHVEEQLAQLDISGVPLNAAFGVYAAMAKPPRRIKTWTNGWLVRRDAHREAEEERQAQLVQEALRAVDEALRAVSVESAALLAYDDAVVVTEEPPDDPTDAPTNTVVVPISRAVAASRHDPVQRAPKRDSKTMSREKAQRTRRVLAERALLYDRMRRAEAMLKADPDITPYKVQQTLRCNYDLAKKLVAHYRHKQRRAVR